ncbi:MAG: hypothetical protein JKY03_00340 [Aureispira sp.]|nr:hypothetical protein [Aureispira sp.]
MKKTIGEIIKWVFIVNVVLNVNSTQAQVAFYPEVYPSVPFNLAKATELGNNKCSIWKGIYKKGADDRSGETWTNPIEEAHQYQRYEFMDGKMSLVSTYFLSGFKEWSMEFFYKENLVSAVEKLNYDSLQNTSLAFTYAYKYEYDGTPFQRVKMYGHPNKGVRLLDQFEFDSLNRAVRQKTTAVGYSPQMDSLVGLLDKEKLLTITEYTDSTFARRIYKNMYETAKDEKTFLDETGQAVITQVWNASGKILFTIDYKYDNNQLTQKIHWVMREQVIRSKVSPEVVPIKKKQKKKKLKKSTKLKISPRTLEASASDVKEAKKMPPKPEVYKLEYFTYNMDGLLEIHITEEDGVQTILEYTYFSE